MKTEQQNFLPWIKKVGIKVICCMSNEYVVIYNKFIKMMEKTCNFYHVSLCTFPRTMNHCASFA